MEIRIGKAAVGSALTRCSLVPKMALRIFAISMTMPTNRPSRNMLRAIATDVHFWIPLVVLIGGLILLDKLR